MERRYLITAKPTGIISAVPPAVHLHCKDIQTIETLEALQDNNETSSMNDELDRVVDNHTRLSWTACYDDNCRVHISEKEGSGW